MEHNDKSESLQKRYYFIVVLFFEVFFVGGGGWGHQIWYASL